MRQQDEYYIGIDVAKTHLDIAVLSSGEHWTVANDDLGIGEVVNRLKQMQPVLIVMEETGGLEIPVSTALVYAKLPIVVINPR